MTSGRTPHGNDHQDHGWNLDQVGFGWEGREARPSLRFKKMSFKA